MTLYCAWCCGQDFFSNPNRLANLWPSPAPPVWQTSDIGAVFQDNFDRATLGTNWIIDGDVNAALANNQLQITQTNTDYSRRLYYWPWQICSDSWTLRWTQRFGALNGTSKGVGVGLANFQSQGGDDRGYNGMLWGSGPNLGQMQLQEFNGSTQRLIAAGSAITLAAGDTVDCWLTRSNWTLSVTASNRSNAQVSATTIEFSDPANLEAPVISRACIYPLGGTIYIDDLSFTINHRKPARFIVVGDSISDGYNATSAPQRYISVVQSNFTEAVCNDSSSYNTTTNSVSVLPEILAHQPGTAILMIGGNDLYFGFPTSQWQSQYSNLVAQLQANGILVKHCLPTPRNTVDLRPLKNWLTNNYPAANIINTWNPLLSGASGLNAAYDSGDGTHPNNAGHLLIGQIIRTNLP